MWAFILLHKPPSAGARGLIDDMINDEDNDDVEFDETSSAFGPAWSDVIDGMTQARLAAGKKVRPAEIAAVKQIAIDIFAAECVLACVISGKYDSKVKDGKIYLLLDPKEYAGLPKQIIPEEDQDVFQAFRKFCVKKRVTK